MYRAARKSPSRSVDRFLTRSAARFLTRTVRTSLSSSATQYTRRSRNGSVLSPLDSSHADCENISRSAEPFPRRSVTEAREAASIPATGTSETTTTTSPGPRPRRTPRCSPTSRSTSSPGTPSTSGEEICIFVIRRPMLIKIFVTPPPGLSPHTPCPTQPGVPVDDNLFEVSEVGGYDSFKRD